MSTVAQLIARAKAENKYNNSAISSDAQWWDFFNEALRDLVDDLGIVKTYNISFVDGTREYDLPSDYFALIILNDGTNRRVVKRRHYDQQYPAGYWVFNRGSSYVIDLYDFGSTAQTFTIMYQAYATAITGTSDTPAIPQVAEKALIYFAVMKALANNNQLGQAQEYERKYEEERKKIRNAAARGGG